MASFNLEDTYRFGRNLQTPASIFLDNRLVPKLDISHGALTSSRPCETGSEEFGMNLQVSALDIEYLSEDIRH